MIGDHLAHRREIRQRSLVIRLRRRLQLCALRGSWRGNRKGVGRWSGGQTLGCRQGYARRRILWRCWRRRPWVDARSRENRAICRHKSRDRIRQSFPFYCRRSFRPYCTQPRRHIAFECGLRVRMNLRSARPTATPECSSSPFGTSSHAVPQAYDKLTVFSLAPVGIQGARQDVSNSPKAGAPPS